MINICNATILLFKYLNLSKNFSKIEMPNLNNKLPHLSSQISILIKAQPNKEILT